MTKRLGNIRATYLAALCCIGSFLFAYDNGIVGGVLTLASFESDFRYTTAGATDVSANSTSLLQAGAFFACFFVWPFTARFGRRWSIVLASVVFSIGAILQTINSHSIGCFYAARVISGIGVGMATVVIPMYSAEMAPKGMRGMLGGLFQFLFTCGVMTSYWVDYGVSKHMKQSTAQWQIAIGLQLVPGVLLGLGMLLTKESTRWLAKRGHHERAMASLTWVRGGERTQEVEDEFSEILAGIEEERHATEGLTWKELLLPANRKRVLLIICIQIGVQMSGNTSLAYFTPQIFKAIGAGNDALLLSGFFGVVKVIACGFFVLVLAERLGRRWSLFGGAVLMGSYMLIVAVLTAVFPPKAGRGFTPSGAAAVAVVYLEAMSYNISWGPVPWIYTSEIFPNRIREPCVAIGIATQWLFNFVFSRSTPYAVKNLGWRLFLMFGIFNYALVVFVWFFIPETKGKSLEEMEALFGSQETAIDFERARQKAREEDVVHVEEEEERNIKH